MRKLSRVPPCPSLFREKTDLDDFARRALRACSERIYRQRLAAERVCVSQLIVALSAFRN